jgi:hypothetical protein
MFYLIQLDVANIKNFCICDSDTKLKLKEVSQHLWKIGHQLYLNAIFLSFETGSVSLCVFPLGEVQVYL